jgi:hypothetical protein
MKMTHTEPTAMPFVEQVAKEQTERKAVVNATGRQRNPGSAAREGNEASWPATAGTSATGIINAIH